eukprot:jgi/Mesvir1/22399/Mv17888-RA.2
MSYAVKLGFLPRVHVQPPDDSNRPSTAPGNLSPSKGPASPQPQNRIMRPTNVGHGYRDRVYGAGDSSQRDTPISQRGSPSATSPSPMSARRREGFLSPGREGEAGRDGDGAGAGPGEGRADVRSIGVQAAPTPWMRFYFPDQQATEGNDARNPFYKHFDVKVLSSDWYGIKSGVAEDWDYSDEYIAGGWQKSKYTKLYYTESMRKGGLSTPANEKSTDIATVDIDDFARYAAQLLPRTPEDLKPLLALKSGLLMFVINKHLRFSDEGLKRKYEEKERELARVYEKRLSELHADLRLELESLQHVTAGDMNKMHAAVERLKENRLPVMVSKVEGAVARAAGIADLSDKDEAKDIEHRRQVEKLKLEIGLLTEANKSLEEKIHVIEKLNRMNSRIHLQQKLDMLTLEKQQLDNEITMLKEAAAVPKGNPELERLLRDEIATLKAKLANAQKEAAEVKSKLAAMTSKAEETAKALASAEAKLSAAIAKAEAEARAATAAKAELKEMRGAGADADVDGGRKAEAASAEPPPPEHTWMTGGKAVGVRVNLEDLMPVGSVTSEAGAKGVTLMRIEDVVTLACERLSLALGRDVVFGMHLDASVIDKGCPAVKYAGTDSRNVGLLGKTFIPGEAGDILLDTCSQIVGEPGEAAEQLCWQAWQLAGEERDGAATAGGAGAADPPLAARDHMDGSTSARDSSSSSSASADEASAMAAELGGGVDGAAAAGRGGLLGGAAAAPRVWRKEGAGSSSGGPLVMSSLVNCGEWGFNGALVCLGSPRGGAGGSAVENPADAASLAYAASVVKAVADAHQMQRAASFAAMMNLDMLVKWNDVCQRIMDIATSRREVEAKIFSANDILPQLREIKNYTSPPPEVLYIFFAAFVLLGKEGELPLATKFVRRYAYSDNPMLADAGAAEGEHNVTDAKGEKQRAGFREVRMVVGVQPTS